MYNKFKNIRIIGLIVIALCIIGFFAANVRIQSVNDYKKFNNGAIIGQNVETKEAGITKDREDKSNTDSSGDNKGDDKPSGPIVTCTIEIRCDNASRNKDKVTNPGALQYIPDDGTILAVTSYSAVSGYTVYDVLADVAKAHDIPISATYDKSYVRSINNLSEKDIDVRTDKTKPNTSGWTYRVNGELVMLSANKCTVKDGDVIKWIYVCQWGDS